MDEFLFLTVDVRERSIGGLPDDWAPIFIARLTGYVHATYFAIIAPKQSIPKGTAWGKIAEARIILFLDHESVLDVCVADSCHRSEIGGSAKFDKGKITILFERSLAWYDTTKISRDDIIFSL